MSAASAISADGASATREPPNPRSSGGIFSYWFGNTRLRADPSEVFAGLVYRLKARDASFTQHELSLLKQCETDVQVRAVTAGYVTGAGMHSALGFLGSGKKAPRMMLSVVAGAAGAYVGVQSLGRDCMRRIARLEDSKLAEDARFVIRQVNPNDPLGKEPNGAGSNNRTVGAVKNNSKDPRARVPLETFSKTLFATDDKSEYETKYAYETIAAVVDKAENEDVAAGSFGENHGSTPSVRISDGRVKRGDGVETHGEASTSDSWTSPFAMSDIWGVTKEHTEGNDKNVKNTRSTLRRDGRWNGRESRKSNARNARYVAAEATRARRIDEENRNAAREGYFDSPPLDATSSRDELRDPARRIAANRGTRRTPYGDVLDR